MDPAVSAPYVVGLDGRDRSLAAVRFAAWLRRLGPAPLRSGLVGVHGVTEADLQTLGDRSAMAKLIEDRRRTTWDQLAQAELDEEFERVHVEHGGKVVDVLETVCRRYEAFGLIVGRRAKTRGRTLPPRLGSIARQLVRRPRSPLIVVPPDYNPHRAGNGTVLALTDLTETSVPAFAFAVQLAARTGRAVTPLHIVPVPEGYGRHYLGRDAPANKAAAVAKATDELSEWSAAQGHAGTRACVRPGAIVEQTLAAIEELDPLALVVGTRELTLGERILLESHSSELAARAPCPVAVVGPPH